MSHGIAKTLRNKLETLDISDFHGLISPGLTCYLNSVLQVLFMTEEFRDRIKRCSQEVRPLDTHLKDLFTTLERNRTKTHAVTQILGIVDVYEQRDAAEYFEKILRLTNPKASKLFKGELKHMIECDMCKNRSDARGFFWILPLSITDPYQTYRVNKGLEDFFTTEKVDGENQMYCAQCDKKQETNIMCEMTEPPDVLTLLLKRFHHDYELKRNVKLNCEAEVPLVLQIKDCIYDLYALVKHYGNLSGGHYVAYIYSVQTKEWYCFDDERVKLKRNYLVSGKTFLRSFSAYLLMYMKRRRNPENTAENKEEVLNSHNEAKQQRSNREDEAHEDKKTFEKMTETGKETIRITSAKSQGQLNGLLNSADSIMQRPESFSNNQASRKKRVNKVGTSESQKSVYTSDMRVDQTPKSCKRSDSTKIVKDKSLSKKQAWKH